MPVKKIKRWSHVSERTSHTERSAGLRSFKVEGSLTSWEIVGLKLKNNTIIFHLKGFSGYKFTLSNGVLRGDKTEIKRPSDSGVLWNKDYRFNLTDDKGKRSTVRMASLIDFLPEAFL